LDDVALTQWKWMLTDSETREARAKEKGSEGRKEMGMGSKEIDGKGKTEKRDETKTGRKKEGLQLT